MHIDIISLFPEYFRGPLDESIVKRAQKNGYLEVSLVNIRDYTQDKHRRVDDRPYGGGPGMVMMAEPVCLAVRDMKKRAAIKRAKAVGDSSTSEKEDVALEQTKGQNHVICAESALTKSLAKDAQAEVLEIEVPKKEPFTLSEVEQVICSQQALHVSLTKDPVREVAQEKKSPLVIYLSPQGVPLSAQLARSLACEEHLILLCGHYEGIDERALESEVDLEVSIGDYVLTNGCLAACVLVDTVIRFIPGVLGDERAADEDSFENGMLDCVHYTRPEVFEGKKVPDVLLSGNHAEIASWRKMKALEKTKKVRPDLYRALKDL